MPKETVVIVTTFNERDNLPSVVQRILALPVQSIAGRGRQFSRWDRPTG